MLYGPVVMDAIVIEKFQGAHLRDRAAARLKGHVGANGAMATTVNALAVLHALASSPDTAADALTLLHELQLLQVELELQAEELRESRLLLETALGRQTELFDHQPVGCFAVDRRLRISRLNLRAAEMLGVERYAAQGLCLDNWVSAATEHELRQLVSRVEAGAPRACSHFVWVPKAGARHPVRAHLGVDPSESGYFLVIAAADDDQESVAPAS
jgi:PAS domain S-box-containing protein